MDAISSPQPVAVGEAVIISSENCLEHKVSYASKLSGQQATERKSQIHLHPIVLDHGFPSVEFTVDEINSFTKEEGLHQAVIFKLSYGKPDLHVLRQLLPKQLAVKGRCIIGQLEYRHILVRFDLFEDFAQVVSRTNGYLKFNGKEFFYRTFPWTMGFNPRKETSKAVVWISLPELPANLFAQNSILSIASSVGKPIAVDKATKDRSRPSTARVKVLINLLDKHPSYIKIKIVDPKTGDFSTFDQKIVIDNAPAYCSHCCHQGHNVKSCRRINEKETMVNPNSGSIKIVEKLQGDARDLLNAKRDSQRRVEQNKPTVSTAMVSDAQHRKLVWKQKDPPIAAAGNGHMEITNDVSIQQGGKGNSVTSLLVLQQCNNLISPNASGSVPMPNQHKPDEAKTEVNCSKDPTPVIGLKDPATDVSTTNCAKSKVATDKRKKPMTSCMITPISMADFIVSKASSSHVQGSTSGSKYVFGQQLSNDPQTVQFLNCKAKSLSIIPSSVLAGKEDVADGNPSDVRDYPHASNEGSQHRKNQVDYDNDEKSTQAEGNNGDDEITNFPDEITVSLSKEGTAYQTNDREEEANQLYEDSFANVDMNPETLIEDKVQCSLKGNQEFCHQNPTENRIGNSILVQPIAQQQLQNNASPNCSMNTVDEVHDNGQPVTKDSGRQNAADEQQDATNFDSLKNNSNLSRIASSSASFMEKMEILNENKIGGVIKKVISITPLSISNAYSGEDIIDNEEISSFEESSKQAIISSMKESVIKSKLWDQRPFSDEVNWDEDSSGGSSTEEENCSSGDESDNTIKPNALPSLAKRNEISNSAVSANGLNHNAPIFIPNKPATSHPSMETKIGTTQTEHEQNAITPYTDNSGNGYGSISLGFPSEQFPIQNEREGRHIYEEGEEEDFLTQCQKNAARRGDLSPMHSIPNKKNHRREISWDDGLVDHAAVRKLPMRMAKQKQVSQPSVTKPRKSKNKAP